MDAAGGTYENDPAQRAVSPTATRWGAGRVLILAAALLTIARPAGAVVCATTATELCLRNRFLVSITWQGYGGDGGDAGVVDYNTFDSGLFYFYGPGNWEVMVKVLDACGSGGGKNNRFWVFGAASTTLAYQLTVLDTVAGVTRTYTNSLGTSSPAITDTNAFNTCGGAGPTPTPTAVPTPTPTAAGASQVRYTNEVFCNYPAPFTQFTSTISANGYSWSSLTETYSNYKTVKRSTLGPFTETNDSECIDATYNKTFNLVAGQRYRLVQRTSGGVRSLNLYGEGPIGSSSDVADEASLLLESVAEDSAEAEPAEADELPAGGPEP